MKFLTLTHEIKKIKKKKRKEQTHNPISKAFLKPLKNFD